jgi:glucan phosphoethanolaminetransferase (alkaline phosphatase superfamily)
MDSLNNGSGVGTQSPRVLPSRLRQTPARLGATMLANVYHKTVRLDLLLWLPGLVYYVWLNRLIVLGAEFGTPSGQLRGVLFVSCQSALLFLAVLTVDGVLAAKLKRGWRITFVVVVQVFLASLYSDCVLYRLMAVHLGQGLAILCQGGLSRLGINWAHTGIPSGTARSYMAWGAAVVLGIAGYSWAMVRHHGENRKWPLRVKLGRLGLLAVYLLVVCQMLSVSDDYDYRIAFSGLRKSMPVRFSGAGTRPGQRFLVPGLRPLRDAKETLNALQVLRIEPGTHPDVFLFVLESARGDFINREVTPHLDQFRAECLPFPIGLAAANASHVSWYSLLAANHGLYFGAEKRARRHEGSVPLELFRRLGYKINVLCSSTLDYHEIDRIVFGSDLRLCDSMFDAQKSGFGDAPSRDLTVTQRLLQAVDQPSGNRLFLVFYHSTHHDYDWPPDDPAPFAPYAATWNYGDFSIGQERLGLIMNRYRNAFHFQDRLVGQVLDRLREKRIYENSIIAVTGDHGEEFLEHGKLLHASNLFRPQTCVPFLMRIPATLMPPGDKTRQLPAATHVDLLPTVLDVLELQVGDLFDGQSLLGKTADQAVIAAENRDWDPVRFCLQSPRYKAFFEYEHERRPTASHRTLYLTQITDLNDVPLKIDLASLAAKSLLRTNFAAVFQSLYPGFSR